MEKVSVIVPAFNEKETITPLVERIIKTFKENQIEGEVIIIDDGSTDGTGQIADALSKKYGNVKAFHHKRNLGKSAALNTGFKHIDGDIVVTIDADLQYLPEDVPRLVKLINEGYDVVNGWGRNRRDPLGRKLSSLIYNFLIRKLFKSGLHDHNCGLKAFRKEVIRSIALRRELHRYMVIMALIQGYNVCEIEIQHFPRQYGKGKYRIQRLLFGFLDLLAFKISTIMQERPIAIFGTTGFVLTLIGVIIELYLTLLKAMQGVSITQRLPLFLLGILLIITGIISFFFGFLADMISALRIELMKKYESRKND
jgi:glycosyltransferase involved in cell wall biosynthesis